MEQVLERPQAVVPGEGRLTYYTTQPSPTQWVAVGVLTSARDVDREPHHRLVVGNGRTEAAAIAALRRRIATLPAR